MTSTSTYTRLITFLDQRGARYRLIDHPPEGRTEAVSPMRGNALSQAAKCIVLMVKIGKKVTRYVLGVVPGDAHPQRIWNLRDKLRLARAQRAHYGMRLMGMGWIAAAQFVQQHRLRCIDVSCNVTGDLGGAASTSEVGDALVRALG